MTHKKVQQPPDKSLPKKPPSQFTIALARLFRGDICESYVRDILLENNEAEFMRIINKNRSNPANLDKLDNLLYTLLGKKDSTGLSAQTRAFGNRMRQLVMKTRYECG